LELEAKIADVIDETKEEMFEYFAERESMSLTQKREREAKYDAEVRKVAEIMTNKLVRSQLHAVLRLNVRIASDFLRSERGAGGDGRRAV
jgi:hypothetical protein